MGDVDSKDVADLKDALDRVFKQSPFMPLGTANKQAAKDRRFYAACAAMQGMLAPSGMDTDFPEPLFLRSDGITNAQKVARCAFAFADALIEEEGKS